MNPYQCPECDGDGEEECYHCGNMMDCEACDGTGLDDSKIDVEAFKKAERSFNYNSEGQFISSWDMVDSDGTTIGRQRADGAKLRYDQFLIDDEDDDLGSSRVDRVYESPDRPMPLLDHIEGTP